MPTTTTTTTAVTPMTLLVAVALAMFIAACSGKLPRLSSSAHCGDQCSSMTCPGGSHCVLDGTCTARCEQETLYPK